MIVRDKLATAEKPSMLTLRGKPYLCAPLAEVPDDAGEALLKFTDRYERVVIEPPAVPPPPKQYVCDVCNHVALSPGGLGSHKRKHKETT